MSTVVQFLPELADAEVRVLLHVANMVDTSPRWPSVTVFMGALPRLEKLGLVNTSGDTAEPTRRGLRVARVHDSRRRHAGCASTAHMEISR